MQPQDIFIHRCLCQLAHTHNFIHQRIADTKYTYKYPRLRIVFFVRVTKFFNCGCVIVIVSHFHGNPTGLPFPWGNPIHVDVMRQSGRWWRHSCSKSHLCDSAQVFVWQLWSAAVRQLGVHSASDLPCFRMSRTYHRRSLVIRLMTDW